MKYIIVAAIFAYLLGTWILLAIYFEPHVIVNIAMSLGIGRYVGANTDYWADALKQ